MKNVIAISMLAGSMNVSAVSLYADDGKYLGEMNANKYDSNSISNPYGRYGSPYSSESVNNLYRTSPQRYGR